MRLAERPTVVAALDGAAGRDTYGVEKLAKASCNPPSIAALTDKEPDSRPIEFRARMVGYGKCDASLETVASNSSTPSIGPPEASIGQSQPFDSATELEELVPSRAVHGPRFFNEEKKNRDCSKA
jgi:hypothetical protein